jgi:hypothetical protein
MATQTVEIEIDYNEIASNLEYSELASELNYTDIEVDYDALKDQLDYDALASNLCYRLERQSSEVLMNKIIEQVAAKVADILSEKEKKSDEKVSQVRDQLTTLLEALK